MCSLLCLPARRLHVIAHVPPSNPCMPRAFIDTPSWCIVVAVRCVDHVFTFSCPRSPAHFIGCRARVPPTWSYTPSTPSIARPSIDLPFIDIHVAAHHRCSPEYPPTSSHTPSTPVPLLHRMRCAGALSCPHVFLVPTYCVTRVAWSNPPGSPCWFPSPIFPHSLAFNCKHIPPSFSLIQPLIFFSNQSAKLPTCP